MRPWPSCPTPPGNGYWVVTSTGAVYTFGDATNHGAPGPQSSAITSAVATSDRSAATGSSTEPGRCSPSAMRPAWEACRPVLPAVSNPASAIFDTSDGGGYWVVTALGKVSNFGDAPNDGDMSGTHLNGPIIAASGS